jgi:hypothetical protein
MVVIVRITIRIISSQEVVCLAAARSITIPIIKATVVVFLVRITTTTVAVDSLTIKEEEIVVEEEVCSELRIITIIM